MNIIITHLMLYLIYFYLCFIAFQCDFTHLDWRKYNCWNYMWKLAFSHVDFCFHCLTCSIPVVRKHFQSEWKTVMIIFGSTVFSKKGKSFCGPILILIFLLQNTVTCFKAYEHNYNTFNVLYWIYFLSVLYSLSIGFLTCRLHFLPLRCSKITNTKK